MAIPIHTTTTTTTTTTATVCCHSTDAADDLLTEMQEPKSVTAKKVTANDNRNRVPKGTVNGMKQGSTTERTLFPTKLSSLCSSNEKEATCFNIFFYRCSTFVNHTPTKSELAQHSGSLDGTPPSS